LSIVALALTWFTVPLASKVFGVVPAPDGGYPGGNTAEGQNALFSLTTGGFNTGVGFFALRANTSSRFNTAVGAGTLLANTADRNTANGAAALLSNGTGVDNTAIGAFALLNNTQGNSNTATGAGALFSNIGSFNTANGVDALHNNGNASANTAIGAGALTQNLSGNGNTALGVNAGFNVTTATNVIAISSTAANVSDTCFIGNIRGVGTVNNNAIPVLIDSDGQLGTVSSSLRFKKDIEAMDKSSEAILALKPVTFHYKSDSTNRPEFGLIAEEVAKVNPDLVVRDNQGEIYTVRYEAVNAMLLNEFLKAHRKVQELEANAARQQEQIEALTAGLQKASAQLEVSKAKPQTVVNNH
jgi:hypothetical protein